MADLTFNQQLQKHRVKIARVIWIALILFLFVYKRIPVMPLDSTFGILGIIVILLGVTVRSLSAGALRKNEVLAPKGSTPSCACGTMPPWPTGPGAVPATTRGYPAGHTPCRARRGIRLHL